MHEVDVDGEVGGCNEYDFIVACSAEECVRGTKTNICKVLSAS